GPRHGRCFAGASGIALGSLLLRNGCVAGLRRVHPVRGPGREFSREPGTPARPATRNVAPDNRSIQSLLLVLYCRRSRLAGFFNERPPRAGDDDRISNPLNFVPAELSCPILETVGELRVPQPALL